MQPTHGSDGSDTPPRNAREDLAGKAGIIRDTFISGAGSMVVSFGWMAQLILISRSLGVVGLGKFSLVEGFVMLVGQFFDVRSNRATVTFGARRMTTSFVATAGVIQFGYIVDLITGVLGFAIVAVAAPFVGGGLIGPDGTTLIWIFSLTLLFSFGDDTSKGVLRLLGRFSSLTLYAIVQECLRLVLILVALTVYRDLKAVFVSLVLLDLVSACAFVVLSSRAFKQESGGVSLRTPALSAAKDDRGAMVRMIFHTNLSTYAMTAQTKGPTLVLGALHGPHVTGVFRAGMIVAKAVGITTDPLINVMHPRIARLWAAGRRDDILNLLRWITLLTIAGTALAASVLIVFRKPAVRILARDSLPPGAEMVLILGVIAFAIEGAFFWKGTILMVTNRASWLSGVQVVSAIVLLGALIPLAVIWEATGAALAFLIAMGARTATLVYLGIRSAKHDPLPSVPEPAAVLELPPESLTT